MSSQVTLEAIEISKSYRSGADIIRVLKGASIKVGKGEIVAVVGPSGVGKSTLLHILGGLDRPDSGKVMIDGCEISSLPEIEVASLRNSRIGFVFQFHHLLPELNCIENVMIPCIIAGLSPEEAQKKAKDLLCEIGLGARLKHLPRQLSGGEQQRVAVARALVMNPSIVLADEPSGNLDPENASSLHDLIWRLRERLGQSYVIATHNLDLARRADRVLKLFDGTLKDINI